MIYELKDSDLGKRKHMEKSPTNSSSILQRRRQQQPVAVADVAIAVVVGAVAEILGDSLLRAAQQVVRVFSRSLLRQKSPPPCVLRASESFG